MILQMFDEDLLPEHRNVPTSQVKFEHFTANAQAAITAAARATFYRDLGTTNENYNAIYPPPEPHTCPNCGKHTRHELRCVDCGTYFCNYCMGTKTTEEIARSKMVKCPVCSSLNTEPLDP